MSDRLVSNTKLRKAFLASGVPAYEVAERAGVLRKVSRRRGTPRLAGDGTTLERELGIKRTSEGNKKRKLPETRALRYAAALHLYPVDVGL
ncbi:MAG: hypothetical protein ACRDPE_19700 [Solirubrobacterales bacterium]